jgi:nitrate reductase beta subunit
MAKWGMVIDLDKCTGCQACTTACSMENNRLPGENWQDVLFYHEGTYPNVKLMWFPRPCMHCENPSCVSVCPTKATYKDPEGGLRAGGLEPLHRLQVLPGRLPLWRALLRGREDAGAAGYPHGLPERGGAPVGPAL